MRLAVTALAAFLLVAVSSSFSTALQFKKETLPVENIYVADYSRPGSARTIQGGYIKGSAVFTNRIFATFSPGTTLQEFYNSNNFTMGVWFKRTNSSLPVSLIKIGSSVDLRVVSSATATTVELAAFGAVITVSCNRTETWSHITLEYDRSRSAGEMYLWCTPQIHDYGKSLPTPNQVSFGGAALTFDSPTLTVGEGPTSGRLYVAQGVLYNHYLNRSDVITLERGYALETSVNASVIVQALNRTHLQGFTGNSLVPFVTPITLASFTGAIEDVPIPLVCPAPDGCDASNGPVGECDDIYVTNICGEQVPCFRCPSGDKCTKDTILDNAHCYTPVTCESAHLNNSAGSLECPNLCRADQYPCNGKCYDEPMFRCDEEIIAGYLSPQCFPQSYCSVENITCGNFCEVNSVNNGVMHPQTTATCGNCATGQTCNKRPLAEGRGTYCSL